MEINKYIDTLVKMKQQKLDKLKHEIDTLTKKQKNDDSNKYLDRERKRLEKFLSSSIIENDDPKTKYLIHENEMYKNETLQKYDSYFNN